MTVKTKVIKIGNSRGIRIPKELLELTNISDGVIMVVKGDTISISPEPKQYPETYLMSRGSLAKDWDSEEEDKAWAIYNQAQ